MKKLKMFLGVIAGFIVCFIVLIFVTLRITETRNKKTAESVVQYLHKKYDDSFEIVSSNRSGNGGLPLFPSKIGSVISFNVYSKKWDLTFYVSIKDAKGKFQIKSDHYKEAIVRGYLEEEIKKEYGHIIDNGDVAFSLSNGRETDDMETSIPNHSEKLIFKKGLAIRMEMLILVDDKTDYNLLRKEVTALSQMIQKKIPGRFIGAVRFLKRSDFDGTLDYSEKDRQTRFTSYSDAYWLINIKEEQIATFARKSLMEKGIDYRLLGSEKSMVK